MYGYAGRILEINLTDEETKVVQLREKDTQEYIGGVGLAIKFAYDRIKPKVDALSPDNTLVLATGPVNGTMAPTGTGHALVAKSPLTGGIGVSMAQGFFARNVKMAGYDAMIFEGKSNKPIFIWINDDSVQFIDAKDLWGKTPAQTQETIRKELGDNSVSVAAIGPAGEKLSRIACVIDDRTRVAARTGIGAVMGSKNLKAIAVLGSKDIEVADADGLLEFCREFYLRARGSSAVRHYLGQRRLQTVTVRDRVWTTTFGQTAQKQMLGTPGDIALYNTLEHFPTENFSENRGKEMEKIVGDFQYEHAAVKVNACWSCATACENVVTVPEGPYKDSAARIERQTLWAFGPNCGVDRLDAIVKAIDLCNSYGLDAVSVGNTIGFLMDCSEKGIISYEDMEGLDIHFGNAEAMLDLVRKIGTRTRGWGDTLAEGVKRAAEKIGNGAEILANHVKGLEMTAYDSRSFKTAALGLAVSFRGIDPNRHRPYDFDAGDALNHFNTDRDRGQFVMDMEDYSNVMDSLIICKFLSGVYEGFDDLGRLLNLVVGHRSTAKNLEMVGQRIENLARLFNIREGFSRGDDHLPQKVMCLQTPKGRSKDGGADQEEFGLMLDDYYTVRGWTRDGVPTLQKLKELDILCDTKISNVS